MTMQHDIVFIIPNFESKIGFPLGVATLSAVLQQQGFSIGIVDANSTSMGPAECVSRVLEMRPRLVGMTGYWGNLRFLCDVSNQLRERSASVKQIAGGWWAMICPELALELSAMDCVVCGEADSIITDICNELLDGNSPNHYAGVYTPDNIDKHSDSDPDLLVRDICALPSPAYELFDMSRYTQRINIQKKLGKNSYLSSDYLREFFDGRTEATLGTSFTGRGCYGQCTFCATAGQLRRNLPPESVVENMAHLKERYGVDVFHFDDSLTFSTRKWVKEFCHRLIERDLHILFRSQMRADFKYDDETLSLLRQSGCYQIMIGVETGDSQMLQNMGKGKNVDVELNETAIRDFRAAGIFVSGSFILNMPGETAQTLRNTIDFAKRSKIKAPHGYAIPYPGTELYRYCVRNGYIRDVKDLLRMGDNKFTYVNFRGKKGLEDFDNYYRIFNYNNLPRSTLLRAEKKLGLALYINKYTLRHKVLYRIFRAAPMLAIADRGVRKAVKALKIKTRRAVSLGFRNAPSGACG